MLSPGQKIDALFSKEYIWVSGKELAEIEIVAWDSSLTLFISNNDKLVEIFRKNLHLSKDLSVQNQISNQTSNRRNKLLQLILNKIKY
jgi:hypothetical protein